jgi:hypothetical protein
MADAKLDGNRKQRIELLANVQLPTIDDLRMHNPPPH